MQPFYKTVILCDCIMYNRTVEKIKSFKAFGKQYTVNMFILRLFVKCFNSTHG